MYPGFPPVKTGADSPRGVSTFSPKGTPTSSQYCSHRSLSRISAAARNRRIAASPRLNGPLLFLADALPTAPIIAAPGANTIAPIPSRRRNERRGRAFGATTRFAGSLLETEGSCPFAAGPLTFDFVGELSVFISQNRAHPIACQIQKVTRLLPAAARNSRMVRESNSQRDARCE